MSHSFSKLFYRFFPLVIFVLIWIVRGFSGHYEPVKYNPDMMDYVADASFIYNFLYIIITIVFIFYSLGIFTSTLLPKGICLLLIISLLIGIVYFFEGLVVHNDHFFPLARAALNPLFLLIICVVYVIYDDQFFQKVLSFTLAVTILFILLDIYVLITDVQGLIVRGHTPLLQFRTGAFWGLIFYMSFKPVLTKKDYWILLIGLIWCTLVSFIIVSRSWCIQGFISLLFFSIIAFKNKMIRGEFIVILLLLILFVIPFLYEGFQSTIWYDRFEDKIGQDTRSSQYIGVFNQMPLHYFLFGNGYHTAWIQNNVSYMYIDNQTVMFLYRYGIIPTLTYYLIILIPIFRIILRRKKAYYRNVIMILLWCFAINGLSIFNTLNWDWANILIALASARLWDTTRVKSKNL